MNKHRLLGRKLCLSAAVIFGLLASLASMSLAESEARVYRAVPGSHSIVSITYSPSKKPDTIVFFESRGKARQVQYNHSNGNIGILSMIPGVLSDPMHGRYSVLPRIILQVVDSSANLLIEKDIEIGTYDMSPNGNRIVFLSGPVHPEGDISFHPKKMGLIDLSDGKVHWLLDSLLVNKNEIGIRVHWAGTGIVYLMTGSSLYQIDLESGDLTSTGLKGSTDISPDGNYQLVGTRFPSSERPIRLIHIPTGKDESAKLYHTGENIFTMGVYLADIGWLGNYGSLVYVGLTPRYMDGGVTGLRLKKLTSFIIHLPSGEVVFRDDSGTRYFEPWHYGIASTSAYLVKGANGYQLLDDSIIVKLEALHAKSRDGEQ